MSSILNNPKFRYIVTPAIGFGLGGAIWGWVFSKFISEELSINPLVGLYGGISLGILGSISLGLFTKNSIQLFFRGVVGVIFGLIIGVVSFNLFSVVGGQYFPLSFLFFLFIPFFISGVILTTNFLSLWRARIFPNLIFGGVIFGLSSIFGNVLGAVIGQGIFDSILVHYLISYTVLTSILGGFLGLINYKLHVAKKSGGDTI